jgi:stage II sporulation protein D
MILIGNVLASLILLSSIVLAETSQQTIVTEKREYRVRVLLQEVEQGKTCEWKMSASQGMIIIDPEAKTKTRIDAHEVSVVCKKNHFLINGVRFDQKKLKFEGKEYQGSLVLVRDAHAYYLINSLDIEDYVCSVLRTESWPGWPLEVNKAFAIASRSYVIGVILNTKSAQLPYHVKNTNKHQTYSGVHENPVLREAVDQTKGIFLTHDKKPIIAMFDSCCGGVIPAHIHGVNFNHAPYLARNYPCTYCKDCRVYNWTAQYPIDHVENLFKKEHKQLKKIHHIKVAKTDKAGLVQEVGVKQGKRTFMIHGKRVYSMFDKVKSHYFDIAFDNKSIIFNGKGIGHHLGLCQWGAREMVRLGYDYKSILSFYYPGTNFMRLRA